MPIVCLTISARSILSTKANLPTALYSHIGAVADTVLRFALGWNRQADTFVFKGQRQYLQGLSLCGQCARSSRGQPDAENYKWCLGHRRGINMCHPDRRVNLSVPHAMCCALSCSPCINFLLSEFKVFVTPCQSHRRCLPGCSGTPPRSQEMLFSLSGTVGHLVDGARGPLGSGRLTGVPAVASP